MSRAGVDEGGAAVWDDRSGGQPGVGSSVPAVQLQFGKRDHPAHHEHPAQPARLLTLHSPAAGRCAVCVCVSVCSYSNHCVKCTVHVVILAYMSLWPESSVRKNAHYQA